MSPADGATPQHLVVMGVSGSGKTTLGTLLAERLGWPFVEADDLHPPTNIDKMSAGDPLVDEDRWPWLRTIRDRLTEEARAGRSTVTTCSALATAYRDLLRSAEGRVRFIHLVAEEDVLAGRLSSRGEHFMPSSLLPSQLGALEPLGPDEDGVTIVVDSPPDAVADRALAELALGADDGD